jgi:hypothetical protein
LPVLAGHFSPRLSAQGGKPLGESSFATLSLLENKLHEKARKRETGAGMGRSFLPSSSRHFSSSLHIHSVYTSKFLGMTCALSKADEHKHKPG